jgi:hypothetical protein
MLVGLEMNGTQVKVLAHARSWRKISTRIVTLLAAMTLVGFVMRHSSESLARSHTRAGFFHGVLQGALMPCAFPNLLVGNDVVIYAKNNTGLTYKLGYTFGVNACGAIFFGLFFWRVGRWRKKADTRELENGK